MDGTPSLIAGPQAALEQDDVERAGPLGGETAEGIVAGRDRSTDGVDFPLRLSGVVDPFRSRAAIRHQQAQRDPIDVQARAHRALEHFHAQTDPGQPTRSA